MLYRCSLALALFATLLTAQPPRTDADAQALETRLESNPTDLAARTSLIYFYARTRPSSITDARFIPLRRKHILWMIENHPEHPALADLPGIIEKAGPVSDPQGWLEADRAWRFAAAQATRAETWAHAVTFYRTADPAFALDLAERGLSAFPHDTAIEGAKGTVLAYQMLGIRSLDQYGRAAIFDDDLAKGNDAAAARRQLESTSEAALAANAAQVLTQQEFALTSRHKNKEAADLDDFVERLNTRAVELDPNNPRWKNQLASSIWTHATQKRTPGEKIDLLEKSLTLADNSLRLYVMPELANAYYDAGKLDKAAETANALLDLAAKTKTTNPSANGLNYGGAIHNGNIILGRIALTQKNVEEAKTRLLAAGRVPGTPQLMSFGPNWTLAQDLLAKGERDTVLSYIDLCRAFWTSGKSRLDSWDATIREGGSPNFNGPGEMARTQLLGKPAPDFRLKTLAGPEITLAEFKGKVVLLDFWATWCAPCRAEMPEFEKLHRELGGKDVVILALDANEPQDTVAEYINKEKFTFPVLLSEGTDTVNKYGVNAFPTTLAIDKTGRVADIVIGNSSAAGARLRTAIEKARDGAPAPPPPPSPTSPPPSPAVTAEDFYRDGIRLRNFGDAAGALAAFDRALALRKDWLPATLERATCLNHLRRYSEAIAPLTEAIRIDPNHAAAYSDRGWAHLELGHLDEALADLTKSLEIQPASEAALNNRTRVFIAQKQYARAIQDCDATLRLNPRSAWAASRKAEIQRLMNGGPADLPAPRLLSPAPGAVFDHYPRQTTVVWSEVPGAASYKVEWEYESDGSWSNPSPPITVQEPVATFQFVGAQPGRWRVWPVDPSGHEGPKSDWREFRYTR